MKNGCITCTHYKQKTCQWGYMYDDTDYPYDCCDYSKGVLEIKLVRFTASLEHFLWTNYRHEYALIAMGYTELYTEEMQKEYLEWCKTDEGKEYLEGGKHYHEPR